MFKFLGWVLLIFLLVGCDPPSAHFSIVPRIEYRGFTLAKAKNNKDSLGYLKVYVEDGDGDLGLNEQDTFPPFNVGSSFYYNFVVKIYQKKGDSWELLPEGYNGRFPDLNITHEKQPIQAVITMEMDLSFWKLFLTSNEIKMDVYIYDRALHQSNTVSTPAFTLNL
jgi:hypothetical protein